MTQEQKDLLLKDLCGRLPYGVLIQEDYTIDDEMFLPIVETDRLVDIDVDAELLVTNGGSTYHIDEVKPYLFPMSSMTEDLKNEFYTNLIKLELKAINDEIEHSIVAAFEIDFYHKHHFDYRGLIPIGLAIDATNLNIY